MRVKLSTDSLAGVADEPNGIRWIDVFFTADLGFVSIDAKGSGSGHNQDAALEEAAERAASLAGVFVARLIAGMGSGPVTFENNGGEATHLLLETAQKSLDRSLASLSVKFS